MTFRTLLCAGLICGVALAAPGVHGDAAAQTPPPEFSIDVSGWKGGARPVEGTDQFSHCSISRQYGNGISLALLLSPRYELNIGLLNPAWDLLPDEAAEEQPTDGEQEAEEVAEEEDEDEEPPVAEVNIDGVYVKEFPVQAVADTILMVRTGVDEQLLDLLMRGNNLDITSEQGTYRFALSGTFNSITQLRGCIETALRLVAEARAAAGQARPAPLNAQGIVSILTGAGLDGVEIAVPDPASNPLGLSFAWAIGNLSGGVHQSPRGRQVEIDKFTELYLDQFEALCTEEFQRSEEPSEILRERHALKSASMQCSGEAGSTYVSLFIVLDDNFYTAFFHQGPVSDQAQVNDATNSIRQLIQSQAGG